MSALATQSHIACLVLGIAAGAAACTALNQLCAGRRRKARRIVGKDFRGQPSTYERSEAEAVHGLVAYDICEPLTKEEYDRWLFDIHYHDLLANPHLEKIMLHTVCKDRRARLSSGAEVNNDVHFFRLAELCFRDGAAYDSYIDWFKANPIPVERTPAGKSSFKFYHLSESETISRSGAIQHSEDVATASVASQSSGTGAGRQEIDPSISVSSPCTVLVVGSSGNIGAALVKRLRTMAGVSVLEANRSGGAGAVKLDIAREETVRALDAALPGGIDHVVVCCGASTFGALEAFDEAKWEANCRGKFLAVSRLIVMLANGTQVKCLRNKGSITVTTGQSATTVNRNWPGLAANNAGLDAFVRCAGAGDTPRGIRVNAVSPALVRETAAKAGLPLSNTVPADEVAAQFLPLIFGSSSGEVVGVGMQQVFAKSHQR